MIVLFSGGCTIAHLHNILTYGLLNWAMYSMCLLLQLDLDSAMVVFLHASLVWEMSYFLATYCFLCVIMAFACGAWWIVGPGESMIWEGGWECS